MMVVIKKVEGWEYEATKLKEELALKTAEVEKVCLDNLRAVKMAADLKLKNDELTGENEGFGTVHLQDTVNIRILETLLFHSRLGGSAMRERYFDIVSNFNCEGFRAGFEDALRSAKARVHGTPDDYDLVMQATPPYMDPQSNGAYNFFARLVKGKKIFIQCHEPLVRPGGSFFMKCLTIRLPCVPSNEPLVRIRVEDKEPLSPEPKDDVSLVLPASYNAVLAQPSSVVRVAPSTDVVMVEDTSVPANLENETVPAVTISDKQTGDVVS